MNDARRASALAFLVAGAFFMENLDGTVIATALPKMASSFGTDAVGLGIGITAYLLALSIFVPMSGWIADRYGARTVFASAITLFTVTSALCGLANGVAVFTLLRVVQGLGGAMMVPVGRLVVLRNTEKRDLVRAVATITWPGLVAPIVGPPLGGAITTYLSWRWIFYLNVPLGLIALAVALRLVPNVKEEARTPFDLKGFLLVGTACVLTVVGLDRFGESPAGSTALVAVGLAVGYFALRHLRQAEHPLLPLDALRIRTFAVTMFGGSLFRCAIGATPFLLPLLFQEGFGLSPLASGSLVLWVFAGNLAMKMATTAVLRRFGFRMTLLVNGLLAALSILALALMGPATPVALMAALLFLGGLFRSMQFTAMNTLGYADVPPERMSSANALASTIGGLTFGAGVAFGTLVLRLASYVHGTAGNRRLSVDDYRLAFVLVGVMAALSLYDSFSLPADAGREVSGHRA